MSKKRVGYVDGFVLPVPKKNLATYKKMAKVAGKVWLEHGAIDYCSYSGAASSLSSSCSLAKQLLELCVAL